LNASADQLRQARRLPLDGQVRRVLVVDDNLFDQELTVRLLQQAWPFDSGLEIDRAGNGREALEKLQARGFALVILDWNMPEVGGDAVLRTMREQNLSTPVIVLSGLDRTEVGRDLERFGACFLNKDTVDWPSLHRAIAASLVLSRGWQASSRSPQPSVLPVR
jgi:two-component system, OmpR family, response regulator TctD